jgi:hypothetical protein
MRHTHCADIKVLINKLMYEILEDSFLQQKCDI